MTDVTLPHPCNPDAPVTEDILMTHFLIQPDPEGVKLQGWNERAFSEAKTYHIKYSRLQVGQYLASRLSPRVF